MNRTKESLYPWEEYPLSEWCICGMNHYHQDGEKRLFVSMVKDGRCITREALNPAEVWQKLQMDAVNINIRQEKLKTLQEATEVIIGEATQLINYSYPPTSEYDVIRWNNLDNALRIYNE